MVSGVRAFRDTDKVGRIVVAGVVVVVMDNKPLRDTALICGFPNGNMEGYATLTLSPPKINAGMSIRRVRVSVIGVAFKDDRFAVFSG